MIYDKNNMDDVHDNEYLPWLWEKYSCVQICDQDFETFEEWLEIVEEQKSEQYA
jgi:hypothetical protein